MTFEDLAREIAVSESLSVGRARRLLSAVFDEIRTQALAGNRVGIPQFGVFDCRYTAAGERPVGGVMKKIPATRRVVFRVSSGARITGK